MSLVRQQTGLLFEIAALGTAFCAVRFWFHPVTWLQVAPAFAAILVWSGKARASGPASRVEQVIRPFAIAGFNLGIAYFLAGTVRGVAAVVLPWSLLVSARPLVAAVRTGWPSATRVAATFRSRGWRAGRPVLVNVMLPILLAWGVTAGLHRHLYGVAPGAPVAERNTYGPVRLRIKLPGTSAGIPEPLVVCGRPGNASMVYIRLLPGNRARIGVEFWGMELSQGEEFELPAATAELEVVCYLPAFFPEAGSSAWEKMAPDLRRQRGSQYLITVDGTPRLQGFTNYIQPPRSGWYVGVNPLGGSFISSRFTGTILAARQGD